MNLAAVLRKKLIDASIVHVFQFTEPIVQLVIKSFIYRSVFQPCTVSVIC